MKTPSLSTAKTALLPSPTTARRWHARLTPVAASAGTAADRQEQQHAPPPQPSRSARVVEQAQALAAAIRELGASVQQLLRPLPADTSDAAPKTHIDARA